MALVGQQIQAEISETGKRCRLLERLPEIQTMDQSSGAVLAEILRESPQYTNVAIADATGRVVSSALPFAGEVSVRDTAARVGSDSTLTPLLRIASRPRGVLESAVDNSGKPRLGIARDRSEPRRAAAETQGVTP